MCACPFTISHVENASVGAWCCRVGSKAVHNMGFNSDQSLLVRKEGAKQLGLGRGRRQGRERVKKDRGKGRERGEL